MMYVGKTSMQKEDSQKNKVVLTIVLTKQDWLM